MSNFLKITKNGLKLFSHNEEKIKFRFRKKGGKFVVLNNKKEIIASFDNEESRRLWVYDEKPIEENIWQHLRDPVSLEENVTLNDIYQIIDNNKSLKVLVESLYPNYPIIYDDTEGESATHLIINQMGEIINNQFHLIYNHGFENTNNFDKDTIVEIDEQIHIMKNDESILKGIRNLSFFELIQSIFQISDSPVYFKKDGLYQEDGSKVDFPMVALLNECVLDEELTLGDIFKYVSKDKVLTEFMGRYSWCHDIEVFHQEALKPKKDNDDLWHLEVYRWPILKDNDHICFSPGFIGIGDLNEEMKSYYDADPKLKRPNDMGYSVSVTAMNELADLPVQFNEKMRFWNNLTKQEEHVKYTYTLLDLLDAIYWDVSFYGGPDVSTDLNLELIS